ncbi:MAG: hypothetical protein OSB10_10545, partial [Planctomycetota bacterium]|nr:hypothetical protein [Planctomycetota bacterium]
MAELFPIIRVLMDELDDAFGYIVRDWKREHVLRNTPCASLAYERARPARLAVRGADQLLIKPCDSSSGSNVDVAFEQLVNHIYKSL